MITIKREFANKGAVVVFAVKAGLTNKKHKQILTGIFGQLSDGYWENDPRMDRFGAQMEYDPNSDYIVITRDVRRANRPVPLRSGKEVGHWLALRIRQLTKVWFEHHQDEIEDPKAFANEWRTGSNRVISYFSYPLDVTVKDIKATFEALESIKDSDAISGTEVDFK